MVHPGKGGDNGSHRLSRAVEYLVHRGHREDDVIQRYSMNKIYLYLEAGMENEQKEIRHQALASRMGVNADSKDFEKWVKE